MCTDYSATSVSTDVDVPRQTLVSLFDKWPKHYSVPTTNKKNLDVLGDLTSKPAIPISMSSQSNRAVFFKSINRDINIVFKESNKYSLSIILNINWLHPSTWIHKLCTRTHVSWMYLLLLLLCLLLTYTVSIFSQIWPLEYARVSVISSMLHEISLMLQFIKKGGGEIRT